MRVTVYRSQHHGQRAPFVKAHWAQTSVFNIPCSGRTCKIAGADDFQALKCTRAEAVFLESAEMAEAGTAGVGRRAMAAGGGWRGH